MSIVVRCEACGRLCRVSREHVGRRGRCPACGAVFIIAADRPATYDVFICHADEDQETADAVCAALERRGFRCWIAPRDVASVRTANETIDRCRAMVLVLVLSSHANESESVNLNVVRAYVRTVPIIIFRVEDVPTSGPIRWVLDRVTCLDALTPDMEHHVELLAKHVEEVLGGESQARAMPAPSPPPACAPPASAAPAPPCPPPAAAAPLSRAPAEETPPSRRVRSEVRSELRQAEPSAPATDQVQFSVTAPGMMVAGNCYVIDVWAHLGANREEVLRLAREAQGSEAIRVRSKLGVKLARGTTLSVQLNVRRGLLVVEDPEQAIVWDGEINNVSFPVEVPSDATAGTYPGTVVIRVGDVPLAKIHFVVGVGREESMELQASAPARQYRSAFASYASRDRNEVLGRLQGIQKVLPDLDVFLDVASLRSGQSWYDRLVSEIVGRDVFYLFWSAAASQSQWVEREWRTALERKGIEFIDPVPLVSPEVVPPPKELGDELHFNDWVLAYMRNRKA